MVELDRRVSGDWIDLREAGADPYTLSTFLGVSAPRMERLAAELQAAVDVGLPEYKRTVLGPVFLGLEEMQYQSRTLEQLAAQDDPLTALVFLVMLQRMLCAGAIPLSRGRAAEAVDTRGIGVNQIIAEVKQRIQRSPDFQKHPAVKNILMQVAIYQRERRKMAELLPAIKEEKRDTFKQNFHRTFQRVFDSIRRNYADILAEEQTRKQARRSEGELLRRLPLKELVPVLTDQARGVSRLRSTLAFAREDKYKTRIILVGLYRDRASYLRLAEREESAYQALCGQIGTGADCPQELSRRLREELVRALERIARAAEDSPGEPAP